MSYALEKQITVDSNDNAYVVYKQTDDLANYHIYLSRYFTGESEVIVAPTATSSAATSITSTGAVFHGNITATGGESNTIRGFEYGTTNAYGSTASTTGTYDTGEFTATITGLTPFTTYHYMAYSTNSAGTGTSTDLEFTTDSRSSSGSTGHRPSPRPVTPPVNSNPPPFSPTNNFPPVNNPHFTGTLARGSNNAEVLELQRLLSSLGFLTATPNGFFGPQTEAAVRAFQTANNLPPVGIVGPLTRALLNQIPLPGNPSSVSTPRQLVDLLIAIGVIAPDMAERARGAVGE